MTSALDLARDGKQTCPVRTRVRELRQDRGMSQAELGAAVGVSRQTINSIEVGRYVPSLPLALRMARLFGLQVEEVFDDRVDT